MTRTVSMDGIWRAAGNIRGGVAIVEYCSSPEGRWRLTTAADAGLVPVTAVSEKLLELVGRPALESLATRQFCGRVVKAVLAEEGFVVAQTGIRVPHDPIFAAGSIYKRRTTTPLSAADESIMQRFVDCLAPDELRWIADYAQDKLK
jgi:hypothetical protein